MNNIIKGINSISIDVYNSINERISAFNELHKDSSIIYEIITGRKQALYTLWQYNVQTGERLHVCVLSKDFEKSVDKVFEHVQNKNVQISITEDETFNYSYDPTIFHFGKYKGQKVEDVAKEHIGYLIFFRNNIEAKDKTTEKTLKHVNTLVDFYFNSIAEENKKNCKSEFVGEIGDSLKKVTLIVTKRSSTVNKQYPEESKTTYECVIAGTDNIISFANYGWDEYGLEKDDIVFVSSMKVKRQFQKLGRNITLVNYIRIKSVNGDNFVKKVNPYKPSYGW